MPPLPLARLPKALFDRSPTASFAWRDAWGDERLGLVVRLPDGWAAYENACPHVGTALDWGDGRFFDDAGRYLVCSTHGALFRPEDGFCIAGPCKAESLPRLKVIEEGEVLVVVDVGEG